MFGHAYLLAQHCAKHVQGMFDICSLHSRMYDRWRKEAY